DRLPLTAANLCNRALTRSCTSTTGTPSRQPWSGPHPRKQGSTRNEHSPHNTPLTLRRPPSWFVERCSTRPISHVAAEMSISRTYVSQWGKQMAALRQHRVPGPTFCSASKRGRADRDDVKRRGRQRSVALR